MKKLSTRWFQFCGRYLWLDTFMILMIVVVLGVNGIVSCVSESATKETTAVEVEEKTPEVAEDTLTPPVNVPEPDFVEGNSVLIPGVKPEGKRWREGAIQTFKYKGYCYMAFMMSTSGVGLTQIHCDGM